MRASLCCSTVLFFVWLSVADACEDFSHLMEGLPTKENVSEQQRHDVLLTRIDRVLTKSKVEKIFDCLFRQNEAVFEFFGKSDLYFDEDIYQFVSSNYSFGKVIVETSRKQEYFGEQVSPGLSILKPTFDFDKNGKPYITNIFGFKQNSSGENNFYKYQSGKFVQRNAECLECHAKVPNQLFFRSRFHRILN